MTTQNLLNVGDKAYLMHKRVIVVDIYKYFHLIKVCYVGDTISFFVDSCAVTKFPVIQNSISLSLTDEGEHY